MAKTTLTPYMEQYSQAMHRSKVNDISRLTITGPRSDRNKIVILSEGRYEDYFLTANFPTDWVPCEKTFSDHRRATEYAIFVLGRSGGEIIIHDNDLS